MPVTVVATSGAANANSFVTAAEAEAYLNTRLNSSAWTDGTADNELRALIEATRELTLLPYAGGRVTSTQALSWPRQYAVNPDAPRLTEIEDIEELYFGDTEIPQRIKDATCELALEFLKAGTTDVAARPATADVAQKTVGPISTTYTEPWQRAHGLARFPRVLALIAPLLDESAVGGLEVVRV